MNDPITVAAVAQTRTPEEAARAAPVSLPAGSYEASDLGKALDEATKPKNDDKRDEIVAKAVADHNQIGTEATSLDLQAGYERRTVFDEAAGVTEQRVVFVGDAEEPAAPPAPIAPAPAPAAATKGE